MIKPLREDLEEKRDLWVGLEMSRVEPAWARLDSMRIGSA